MLADICFLLISLLKDFAAQSTKSGQVESGQIAYITKTRLFEYIEKFNSKNWKLLDKKKIIFLLKT